MSVLFHKQLNTLTTAVIPYSPDTIAVVFTLYTVHVVQHVSSFQVEFKVSLPDAGRMGNIWHDCMDNLRVDSGAGCIGLWCIGLMETGCYLATLT